jgi:hypothetical protein
MFRGDVDPKACAALLKHVIRDINKSGAEPQHTDDG